VVIYIKKLILKKDIKKISQIYTSLLLALIKIKDKVIHKIKGRKKSLLKKQLFFSLNKSKKRLTPLI
jgi:hypothetical protein